jgi:pilus assembly protein Flp/PilA
MHKLVLCFLKNGLGATVIECALIAAGISLGIIAAVQSLGTILKGTFNGVGLTRCSSLAGLGGPDRHLLFNSH